MRQSAGALNRTWLAIVGLIMLLLGVAGALVSTGILARLITAQLPQLIGGNLAADQPVIPSSLATYVASAGGAAVLALVGLVLLLLGLLWLAAQVPRKNEAKAFRLHDDPTSGLTTCAPGVITDAVEGEIESLPDVVKASALLRGSAQSPELILKVTANDRADLQELLARLENEVAAHVSTVLGAPLARLGVQFDVDRTIKSSNSVTVG